MQPSVDTPAATSTGRLRRHLGAWLTKRGARVIETASDPSEQYASLSIVSVVNRGTLPAVPDINTAGSPGQDGHRRTRPPAGPLTGRVLRALRSLRGARPHKADGATELISITAYRTSTTTEGWVEQISHCGDGSEVRLALADGTPVKLCLPEGDVEWLGLGVNQIVALQRTTALSA
jgi:hypothetical protein